MGEIYKAKDARLDRYVALKIIREITDPSQVHRFVQEAQIAGGLSHPNMLAIYDIGEEAWSAITSCLSCWTGEIAAQSLGRDRGCQPSKPSR